MKETTMHMLTMRRHIGTLAAIVAVTGLLLTPSPDVIAKEEQFHTINSLPLISTPEPIAAGAWMETLGVTTEGNGESLVLARLTLEPGASLRGHDHPGSAVLAVESGVLETKLIRGTGAVERSNDTVEIVSADAIVTLHAGDSLAYAQDCGKRMTNAGDEPLVMILSLVANDGQPLFSFDAPPRAINVY
jgi:sirohydrochlorin ferrochelatase